MFKSLVKIFIKIIIRPQLIQKAIYILKNNGIKSLFSSLNNTLVLSNQAYYEINRFSEIIDPIHEKSVLIFTHAIGGGSDSYINNRIKDELIDKFNVYIVKYISTVDSFILESHDKKIFSFNIKNIDELVEVVDSINLEKIIINELVSYKDIFDTLDFIKNIKEKKSIYIEVIINDYFIICPNFLLMNNNGIFCGICKDPLNSSCLKANRFLRYEYRGYKIDIWRKTWRAFLKMADSITCFSDSSKKYIIKVYPEIPDAKISVNPLKVIYIRKAHVAKHDDYLNIGVIGNISEFKGSLIIRKMSKIIREKRYKIRIIIIGTIKGKVHNNIKVTGVYNVDSLTDIVEENKIDIIFIPSICSETFSYTTEEAMMMDLPVAVFNIGAPAERVSSYSKGLVIDKIDSKYALESIIDFLNIDNIDRFRQTGE